MALFFSRLWKALSVWLMIILMRNVSQNESSVTYPRTQFARVFSMKMFISCRSLRDFFKAPISFSFTLLLIATLSCISQILYYIAEVFFSESKWPVISYSLTLRAFDICMFSFVPRMKSLKSSRLAANSVLIVELRSEIIFFCFRFADSP